MQKVNLNLIPGSVLPVINVSQYDEGRQFQLAIFNGAASYDLTGKTVVVDVQKTDGHGCEYGAADDVKGVPVVAVSGNIVTITTPQQMTACAGDCAGELKITDSTSTIGTLNFVLMCEPAPLNDETIISDTELPAIIDAARSSAERAEDAAQDAEAAAAHYPYPGDDGYWYVWDVETEQFIKTDVSAAGRAPDITMTATADATSSPTPTVTVTKTGTDEEPDFALAFSGLKGEKGDKGDTGPVGPAGDIADIEEAVGWVGSNLLENHATSQTKDNVVFVVNNDGTITANGTAASPAVQYATIPITDDIVPNTFIGAVLTGCENGGSSTYNYNVQYFSAPSTLATYDIVYGNTPYTIKNYPYIRILARVVAGAQVTNAKWSPMISRNGGEYVPYHPTVEQELWDGEVAEPKNKLEITTQTSTVGGVTFTVNDDKSITLNGSAPSTSYTAKVISGIYRTEDYIGYIITAQGRTDDAYLCVRLMDANQTWVNSWFPSPSSLITQSTANSYPYFQIDARVAKNTSASNVRIYPMLCTQEDWNRSHDYSPYYVPLKDVVPTKFSSSNVAPTEDGATASQNIAVNDLFIRGGALCICDQPISVGGSFTEGTNYHITTLAAVIAALRA